MLRALWQQTVNRWTAWRNPPAPEPVADEPSTDPAAFSVTAAVLNLPTVATINTAATVIPTVGRQVVFRNAMWDELSVNAATGIVTYAREIAVNGKPVLEEMQVHYQDLAPRSDGTWGVIGHS